MTGNFITNIRSLALVLEMEILRGLCWLNCKRWRLKLPIWIFMNPIPRILKCWLKWSGMIRLRMFNYFKKLFVKTLNLLGNTIWLFSDTSATSSEPRYAFNNQIIKPKKCWSKERSLAIFENLVQILTPGGTICIIQAAMSLGQHLNPQIKLISQFPHLTNYDVESPLIQAETLHFSFGYIIQKHKLEFNLHKKEVQSLQVYIIPVNDVHVYFQFIYDISRLTYHWVDLKRISRLHWKY